MRIFAQFSLLARSFRDLCLVVAELRDSTTTAAAAVEPQSRRFTATVTPALCKATGLPRSERASERRARAARPSCFMREERNEETLCTRGVPRGGRGRGLLTRTSSVPSGVHLEPIHCFLVKLHSSLSS